MHARAEFTIEPFVDGAPGAHVLAAVAAMEAAGLQPEIGPFGTVVRGDPRVVTDAVGVMIDAARAAGAERVSVHLDFED